MDANVPLPAQPDQSPLVPGNDQPPATT